MGWCVRVGWRVSGWAGGVRVGGVVEGVEVVRVSGLEGDRVGRVG